MYHEVSSLLPGPAVITGPPDDVIAIENELVNFTCLFSGLPQPVVNWTAFPSLPDLYTVTAGPTSSTLQFEAVLSINLTSVHCTAVNSVGSHTSTNATLTIAGKNVLHISRLYYVIYIIIILVIYFVYNYNGVYVYCVSLQVVQVHPPSQPLLELVMSPLSGSLLSPSSPSHSSFWCSPDPLTPLREHHHLHLPIHSIL